MGLKVSHSFIHSGACADLGVADVLANWQNVFRAINLATGMRVQGLELTDGSEIGNTGRSGKGRRRRSQFTRDVGPDTCQRL